MTKTTRRKKIRLSLPMFPSFAIAFSALVLWLCGTDALPLLPWLCLMSALVTARHVLFEAKFPSFFTLFAGSYIGLFLVYPVVAPWLGMKIPTSNEVFADYCFLAVSGIHLFIIGYEGGVARRAERHWDLRYQTTSVRLFNIICLLLVLNIFAMLLVLADVGSFSRIRLQTRDEMKFSTGILSLAGIYLFGIGAILYPLLAVYIWKQRFRAVIWVPIIVGLEVFLFLAFRVRTFPVIHATGLLMGWFLIAPRMVIGRRQPKRRLRTRLTAAKKTMLVGLAATLIVGMFVLRTFRGQFQQAESLADIQIDVAGSVQYAFEGGGELGYSKWVFKILEVVPEHHGYLCGQSYYRLLFVPIPRSLWPNKPLNSQRIMAQWIDPKALSVQTTPVGIVGDLYVNFGMMGVFGMLVFGYACGWLDRSSKLERALLVSISFAMIFHMARGGFTNPLLNLIVYYITIRYTTKLLCRGLPKLLSPDPLLEPRHESDRPSSRATELSTRDTTSNSI